MPERDLSSLQQDYNVDVGAFEIGTYGRLQTVPLDLISGISILPLPLHSPVHFIWVRLLLILHNSGLHTASLCV